MNGAIFTEGPCACGKDHVFETEVLSGAGVIRELPRVLERFRAKKVFLLADRSTYAAAGQAVAELLEEAEIQIVRCLIPEAAPEPDERSVGLSMMYFDPACDAVVGVGSGVINDIGKIVSAVSGKPYVIVGTAPSMDGYASATSSMSREGLKISLPSRGPDVIIGDTEILRCAPMKLLLSGLGDMLAKYVSLCEWRISHLINGEYYCERIADLVRKALKLCVDNAAGLLNREETAVSAVFDGLIICGAAMNYAGISRPASGVEHYISHVWDMRGASFGTPTELHGIQCAVGTLLAVQGYEKLLKLTPDRGQALRAAAAFDYEAWSGALRRFLGRAAESMIALEAKEGKYNLEAHAERLERILEHWEEIRRIVREELPSSASLEALYDSLGMPKTPEDIGQDSGLLPLTFRATRDIRDKYVLSRLCWDLGVTDMVF